MVLSQNLQPVISVRRAWPMSNIGRLCKHLSKRLLGSLCNVGILPTLTILAVLLTMTACQTAPKKPAQARDSNARWLSDSSFFKDRLARYQQTDRWRYSAKVGIKTPQVQEQANLIWQFADQSNDVRLFGPLGVGAIKLEFDQYGVQLSDSHGVLHRGVSAEELLTRIVGWPIPIEALSYWLRGLPLPGHDYKYQLSESGELNGLRQLDWAIQYSGYREYDGQRLARKLTATKNVSRENVISVKLITKSWQ